VFELSARVMKHDVWGLSGQTAFFLVLAIFPLLLFLVSVLNQAEVGMNKDALNLFLPKDITSIVVSIKGMAPVRGSWQLVSAVISLWAASAGVWAMMRGIHKAYNNTPIQKPIRNRVLSLLFTVGIALAIVLSLGLIVLSDNIILYLTKHLQVEPFIMETPIRKMIMLLFLFVFLTLMYWMTPGTGRKITGHMTGALTAGVLWLAVSSLYELYMTHYNKFSANIYGSIGAFMGLLLWLFILCLIILFGAEVNAYLQDRKQK